MPQGFYGRVSRDGEGKLVSVTWPLVVITALMLSLGVASVSVMSSLRAYAHGESMWSKSERQAIAELRKFSASGAEADYARFEAEIAVPLADRAARLELQKPVPNYRLARLGLEGGGNDPADVAGMMRLFRLFHDSALFSDALAAWTQGDALIMQLADIGHQVHARHAEGSVTAVAAQIQQAEQVHDAVAQFEDSFSTSLGVASREVQTLLLIVLTTCGVALVAIGAALSRHQMRRGERMARALRETEERAFAEQARAHVTLESIADAVICTDRDQRVSYLNNAAEHLTLWSEVEAQGQLLSNVLELRPEVSAHSSAPTDIARILNGDQRSGPTTGVLLSRRDGSVIPIQERVAAIRDVSGAVTGLVLVLRDITQERAAAAQLHHQATHDALTGLANRREFEQRLQRAIDLRAQHGTEYALLYLDLDQFKVINDTCGHAAGDELIRQISWSIRQLTRSEDLLARLGGDEFGLLLANMSPQAAVEMAESVRHRIADLRFTWQDKFFVVNVSIGVLSLNDCLPAVADAMSAADQACYLAKDNGRNRVQAYRPDDQEVRARHGEMQWVERINAALDLDRFVLFAQEIRSIGETVHGSGACYELLVRLIDTDGTLVAPMAFIPAAERYGLMPRVDRWVIAHACQCLAPAYARAGTVPTCMINLSGASVTDPGLADFMRECLNASGLPARCIGIELTETAAIANLERAAQMMNELRKLGCPIALDDFGSGMSSFAYLRTLPVDYLKIDGEFVKDMASDPIDHAVVESIQNIARVMGIKTIAESVENEAILTALTLVGVDYAQGFHLGRPMPLQALLEQRSQAVEVAQANAITTSAVSSSSAAACTR